MDIDELFATVSKEAFRLEALPVYDVEEERGIREHFESTGDLPADFNGGWASMIKEMGNRGCLVHRLRLVSDVLTPYEQFEISQGYRAGSEAGEQIRTAKRASYDSVPSDFWLFDEAWIGEMTYGSGGVFEDIKVRAVTIADREMIDFWLAAYRNGIPIRF